MRDDDHHPNRGGGPDLAPRPTLRGDLATTGGEPCNCTAWPGRTAPVAFPTLAAALAAPNGMEACNAGC